LRLRGAIAARRKSQRFSLSRARQVISEYFDGYHQRAFQIADQLSHEISERFALGHVVGAEGLIIHWKLFWGSWVDTNGNQVRVYRTSPPKSTCPVTRVAELTRRGKQPLLLEILIQRSCWVCGRMGLDYFRSESHTLHWMASDPNYLLGGALDVNLLLAKELSWGITCA